MKKTTIELDETKALKQVKHFEEEIDEVLAIIEPAEGKSAVNLTTDAGYASACDALIMVKERQKILEAEHEGFMVDVKKLVDRVNGWFKGPREKHAKAEAIYKELVRGYNLRLEAQATALRETASKSKDEARAIELYSQADDLAAPKVPGISFSSKRKIEVFDFAKLPKEYKKLVADEKVIALAVERNEKVPGVRVQDIRTVIVTPARAAKEVA